MRLPGTGSSRCTWKSRGRFARRAAISFLHYVQEGAAHGWGHVVFLFSLCFNTRGGQAKRCDRGGMCGAGHDRPRIQCRWPAGGVCKVLILCAEYCERWRWWQSPISHERWFGARFRHFNGKRMVVGGGGRKNRLCTFLLSLFWGWSAWNRAALLAGWRVLWPVCDIENSPRNALRRAAHPCLPEGDQTVSLVHRGQSCSGRRLWHRYSEFNVRTWRWCCQSLCCWRQPHNGAGPESRGCQRLCRSYYHHTGQGKMCCLKP